MLIIFLLVGNTGKNDRTSQVTLCAFSSLPTLVTSQIRVHKKIQSPRERTKPLYYQLAIDRNSAAWSPILSAR